MSNYVRANTTFFGDKDALPTGNPSKTIVGAEYDDEFNAISTAVNTKYDTTDDNVANGVAGLDGSGLLLASVIPDATETTVGGLETATSAEAIALAAADKIIVPSVFSGAAGAWGDLNGGMVSDIQALADPGADRLLGWDDSASAAVGFTLSTGLSISGTTITTDDAAINHDSLAGFLSNEHVNHNSVSMTAGTGLTGGGTIASTRTFNLDISGLTSADATDIAATDGYLFDDGGTMKRIEHTDGGIPVQTVSGTSDTLATADMNTFIEYTNASAVTVTLNTGVGTIGNIVVIKQTGAGQVTVSGTATIETTLGARTRTDHSVIVLVCIAANTWSLYGDNAA